MRYIYFSPHLDDSVLSAGGLIYEQTKAGIPVEIWTFMSGFPMDDELSDYAKATQLTWGMTSGEESIRIRREEDKKSAAVVGAKVVQFDFLDCIYRRGRNGEVLYMDVYVPLNEAEADLPAQIAQTMIAWLKPDDVTVCQLGIGGHVDHVVVRKAAEMLGRPLVYDADIPYSLKNPDELGSKTAGMVETIQPVTETGLQSWMVAIEAHATQMASLFETADQMREKVYSYWNDNKGIRLWKYE